MKIRNGFTLMETLLAVSVSFFLITGGIGTLTDKRDMASYKAINEDVNDIISAFDERFLMDGYSPDKWRDTSWEGREEIFDNLISNEFQSINADKCSGTWKPLNTSDTNINLVDCFLWESSIPRSYEVNIEMTNDNIGFISNVEIFINMNEDSNNLEDEFKNFRKVLSVLRSNSPEIYAGKVFYTFYNEQSNTELLTKECMNNLDDCSIRGNYVRLGDSESLFTDGSNSVISDTISFIESTETTPIQCIRWIKDNINAWTLTPDNRECGIGIYADSGYPIITEIAAANGTFENILINQECTSYYWDSGTKELKSNSGTLTPCGMTDDGNEMFQIVDKTDSLRAFFENFYAGELNADDLTIENLYSSSINSTFSNISNTLEVKAKTQIYNGEVKAESYFYDDFNIKQALNIVGNVDFGNDINISSLTNVTGTLNAVKLDAKESSINGLESNSNITSKGTLIAKETLEINGTASEDSSCSNNGALIKDSSHNVLNCISGKWTKLSKSELTGTIMSWSSNTIPDGWLECNGSTIPSEYSALRAIVGSTTPDLRGVFVRGWQSNNSKSHIWFSDYIGVIDKNRGFNSYQNDMFKSHTHTERYFSGDREDKGGSTGANESLKTQQTSTVGGGETRPENLAFKFIIKV